MIKSECFSRLPIEVDEYFHLRCFSAGLESFTVDDAIKVRDILTKSAIFEEGTFYAKFNNFTELGKVFDPSYVFDPRARTAIKYETEDAKFEIDLNYEFHIKKIN